MLELDDNYQHKDINDLIVRDVETILRINEFEGFNQVLENITSLDVIYGSSDTNANHWYAMAVDVYLKRYGNTGGFNPPGMNEGGEILDDRWPFDNGSTLTKSERHFRDFFDFSLYEGRCNITPAEQTCPFYAIIIPSSNKNLRPLVHNEVHKCPNAIRTNQINVPRRQIGWTNVVATTLLLFLFP
jgi:hypothetical protein